MELQNDYFTKHGEEITIMQISKILHIPKEEITYALDSLKPISSIYEETCGNGGEEKCLIIDKLKSKQDEQNSIVNKIAIKQLISNLEKREKQIVMLRFYKDKTQAEVAKVLGITQVQVSRLEKKILSSMKSKLIS